MKNSRLSYFEKILLSVSLIFCVVILGYNLINGQVVEIIHTDISSDSVASQNSDDQVIYSNSNSSPKFSSHVVNINTADSEELTTLNGIGASLAEKIINYRNSISGFKFKEQLKDVSGIGDAKYNAIKDFITVG